MNAAQFQRLAQRYLLPSIPGFAAKGALLYAMPLDYLLRGFYFERSGADPAAFYLWAFIQPLYVPARHAYFTFGKRLGSGWTIDDNQVSGARLNGQHSQARSAAIMTQVLRAIEEEGLSFIDAIMQPIDLANQVQRVTDALDDPYVIEVVLYTLVLAGEYDRAYEEYARLKRGLSVLDEELGWPREIAQRAAQVMDGLHQHPDETLMLLNTWARQTAHHLRLPEPQLGQLQFARAI